MVDDNTLATEDATKKRDEMVKALRAEFLLLKKKVILDNYYGMKAELAVFGNEIEKLIINASI